MNSTALKALKALKTLIAFDGFQFLQSSTNESHNVQSSADDYDIARKHSASPINLISKLNNDTVVTNKGKK